MLTGAAASYGVAGPSDPEPTTDVSTTRSHEMQSLPTARVAPERAAPARAGEDRASITGISAAIGRLREEVAGVAPSDATVLLTGETGTGKGLVAHVIHRLSTRSTEPFVHVDCAALSPSVIESELARSREWRDTIAARGLGERSLEPPVDRRNAT